MLALDLGSDGLALVAYLLQLRLSRDGEEDVVSRIVDRYIDESHQSAHSDARRGTISLGREWVRTEGAALSVNTSALISLAGVIGGALDRSNWVSLLGVLLWILLMLLANQPLSRSTVKQAQKSTNLLTAYFLGFTAILAGLKIVAYCLQASSVR